HTAAKLDYDFKLLRAVVTINRERSQRFVQIIQNALSPLSDKVIAVLGLAFKPNTDDMRDAKSLEVISDLVKAGATVRAYDPVAVANAKPLLPPGIVYTHSAYEAAEGADGLAIVTEWNEFRFLNMERVKQAMRRPIIFDGRNIYEPERIRRLGFAYHSIGRRPVVPS
ncbi:MAG TPA: UDP binding domain-containing protein, partial [Methylomirabilota bacterium]|nr:UDP binding domain-containing protein [Methylomirabilota bacterium]